MIYPSTFEKKIGFDTVRENIKQLCISPLGIERVSSMAFSTDFAIMSSRLNGVAEMMSILASDSGFTIGNIHDATPQLKAIRVEGTFIPASELHKVRRSLEAIDVISSFFIHSSSEDGNTPYPVLDNLAKGFTSFPTVIRSIDRIIDHFGNVKDTASPQLSEIRRSIYSISGSISSAMRRVIARAVNDGYIEPDTTPSMRDGRLVIPVPPMHKRKFNGIVHDESASGKTLYIEPAEIVEANNRVRELQMEERREITRILVALADDIRPSLPEMLDSYGILGDFDFIHAKAKYASLVDAEMPTLHDKPEMEWYHACHPVLKMSLESQGREIIPLDITLSPERRILLISGPNAGGKSVTLKTAGIVQYMAQCGVMPTVYGNSHIGIFSDIFIDIGDDQSIEDDLSTYSSHLGNMKYILTHGAAHSMVLIDEFGAGTEPQVGGAIAQALLKQFNAMGMWGIITTHFQNLKHFADETPGLVNGSMLYDRQQMRPLFRLSIGHPGSSFAIEIARKIGLPAQIISDASDIVGSDYINLDRYLLDIARDKRYWENKRTAIRQKEKKIDEVLTRYEQDAETLRQHRREIINDAQQQARQIIEGSNAAIERTIHEIKRSNAERERTIEARKDLSEHGAALASKAETGHPLLQKAPKRKKKDSKPITKATEKPITVGDTVKLDGEGVPGKVMEIEGKNAIVAFGLLKTTVAVKRLKHTIQKLQTGASAAAATVSISTSDNSRQRQLAFKRDIDVRGMRVDEAVQAITYFIDDAIQFNAGRVRILHGTGTGALRQSLRQYLDTVPGVRSYSDEHVQFGGAGITVVDLS